MSAKTFTIKNYYEREIPLDDGVTSDVTGEVLPIRVRRFTVAQLQDFMRGFDRIDAEAARFIYRKPDDEEQALRADGETFVLPAAEISRRRLVEMSPETRAAFDAAKLADEKHLAEFCRDEVSKHVWLPPGVVLNVIHEETGEPIKVRDGKGLVEAFGGNLTMLSLFARIVMEENVLSPAKKKQLRLQSALITSSPRPSAAAAVAGAKPDATAASAGSADSAKSGDAPADQVPSLSGSIET